MIIFGSWFQNEGRGLSIMMGPENEAKGSQVRLHTGSREKTDRKWKEAINSENMDMRTPAGLYLLKVL